ncbi:MAG: isocitrate lyase [Proteobacteria bacterium]|nr:isocitrate lyase [Candidatus Fonsibacter sp. PEL5]
MPNTTDTLVKKRLESVIANYSEEDVEKLRGTFNVEYTVSKNLSKKLWKLLNTEKYINTLGGLSGNHAVQHAKAGLKAIYLSGWQVAADANSAGEMYPDQSLYPYDSAPKLVESMINALMRADQIQYMEVLEGKMDPKNSIDYQMPIIADGEAGFGGPLNVYELTKRFIKAGAAGVHFEDQLAAEKKCGHMGGKVLIPTQNAIRRGLAYAPYCDLIWCETAKPDLNEAKIFADAIHKKYPGKLLAYNCSPSFNWKKYLSENEMQTFQQKLGEMGYKFQFITLAGFHVQNYSVFKFAQNYKKDGMAAYSKIQQQEFEAEKDGYTAVKHQREVGTTYFDTIAQIISSGKTSTTAMSGSTESEQF